MNITFKQDLKTIREILELSQEEFGKPKKDQSS